MNVAVLGTGMVGQALAGRLHELGHSVTIGTRDVDAALARTGTTAMGAPEFGAWHADHAQVAVATMSDAAVDAELVVLATAGMASSEALRLAGADNLDGTTVIDISNPLDFSNGMPPTLAVVNTDSVGEQLPREFPKARIVTTLYTVTAPGREHHEARSVGGHAIDVCAEQRGPVATPSVFK